MLYGAAPSVRISSHVIVSILRVSRPAIPSRTRPDYRLPVCLRGDHPPAAGGAAHPSRLLGRILLCCGVWAHLAASASSAAVVYLKFHSYNLLAVLNKFEALVVGVLYGQNFFLPSAAAFSMLLVAQNVVCALHASGPLKRDLSQSSHGACRS